jgi:glycosyltransferase involved in cell wall biosynthesis
MRIAIARTMAEFSLNIYTDNLIAGLKKVRPEWEIIELAPKLFDRGSSSLSLRFQKYYERFWNYPQVVRQQVVDIFHIVEPCDAHIAYWLQKSDTPIVVTCHDLANYFFPDNLQGSVQLPIVSKRAWMYSVNGMRVADHIISISSATAEDTIEILNIDPTDITVIPNAVEAIFQPLPKVESVAFRQQHEISTETFCLLNVGGDHPRKNINKILEAIAILKDKQLPISFWKAGADFTAAQQQFIQDRGLESIVRHFGKPDKSTLLRLYNAADVLVAPSLYEGFGITLLEAMACGTPAITSNASAMPEVVGDAGVLVTPTSADEIAAAAVRLYHDPQFYQELVDRGLERVKAFTWESNAERVAQVYERTLATKK